MRKTSDSLSSIAIPVLIGLIAVKILLFDSYSSTDLEVHRNWKAITHNLPVSQWYKENTSEWTLDYPPFFAFFEKSLGRVASILGMDEVLTIQKEALMNTRILYFMRSTVLASDIFFLVGVYAVCSSLESDRSKKYTFIFLSTHTSLILVDSIHFQYNGILTSLLLLSILLMMKGRLLWAAFVYSILLNFKHIYLYYAPGFVVAYLIHYFHFTHLLKRSFLETIKKGVALLSVLVLPFCLSLAPFVLWSSDASDALSSILSRLFPVQRGLTHAYWSPNAWALYNTLDLILNRVLSRTGSVLPSPEYTSGLVQEYSHTLLPTIGMGASLVCTLISLLPLLSLLGWEEGGRRSSVVASPSFHLLLSSLSFFFFGYHVHEKALLLPLIPLLLLTAQYAIFSPILLDFTLVVSSSLAPLLFTTPELPLRLAMMLFQFSLSLLFVCRLHHQPLSRFLTPHRATLILLLTLLDILHSFLDKAIFPSSPFISLLLISITNALILLSIFIRLISLACPFPLIEWKKFQCLRKERNHREDSISPLNSMDEMGIVAALDMEVTSRDPTLAVVSAVFFDLNEGTKIDSVSEVVIYQQLYIPHFLALSEESHYCNLMKRILKERPHLRPDVIICDGNGRFHPRGFGLACHVGASIGIPTIGVSKNIDWGVVGGELNGRKAYGDRTKELLTDLPEGLGWAALDFFHPHSLNVIAYPRSKKRVFVSAGMGISLSLSTLIVTDLLSKGIAATAEADNQARRLASQISSL